MAAIGVKLLGGFEVSLGKTDVARVPPNEAAQPYEQALTMAVANSYRPLEAHCRLNLGRIHARAGRRDEARAELEAARAMLREMGMTRWLPLAELPPSR